MKQLKFLFTVLFLAVLGLGNAWGAADYTLDATLDANKGKDNGYATAEDITVGDITWNVTGNSTMSPWRIGGKNLSGVDRAVYSKTAYASAVSKIDLTVGAASSVTVNSLKLVYSTNADFSSSTEISGTFAVNSTISFTPASGDFPANAFYKFVFNVTIGSSNKFIEFKKVEFYNATSGNPDPEVPTLSSIAVKTAPTKVAYTEGENFDPAGLVITKTMSNSATEDVAYADAAADFTFSPALDAVLTPANDKVTITYGGKSVDQAITVTAASAGRPENEIFYESFNTNDGTGANDGSWSGSIASATIKQDNEGWVYEKGSGANKCAKFGTGSVLGSATTPAIGQACNATLTFNAAAWNGNSESTTLKLSVVDGGSVSPATVTLKKGEWSTFTVTLTNLTADSKVKFEGNVASNSRFFLDEVSIVKIVAPTKTLTGIEVTGTAADLWTGDSFGHDGITVMASWNEGDPTDVTALCDYSGYDMSAAGAQTVTVTYQGETATYGITIKTIANTQETAYTVAQAIALIDAGKGLTTQVYVKGTVSKIVEAWSTQYNNITYSISDDGTQTSAQFQLFRCVTNNIAVGGDVVALGTLTKFGSTYEFTSGNSVVAYTAPAVETATISGFAKYTMATNDEDDVYEITYNGDGELSVLSSNPAVATIALEGTTVTVHPLAAGTTTITISAPQTDAYTSATKTYTLTVNPAFVAATLPFSFDGGRGDMNEANGIKHTGLGTDYSASPKLKFDGAGDVVVIRIAAAAKKVEYTIKGNGYTAGQFDVLQSADGETYSALKSHTDDIPGTATKVTTDKPAADTRYIKFVYTTKNAGNVALGNIKITAASVLDLAELAFEKETYSFLTTSEKKVEASSAAGSDGAITYSCEDANLTIDAATGVITCTTAGTYTINAAIAATGDYMAGNASCTVKVIEPAVANSIIVAEVDDKVYAMTNTVNNSYVVSVEIYKYGEKYVVSEENYENVLFNTTTVDNQVSIVRLDNQYLQATGAKNVSFTETEYHWTLDEGKLTAANTANGTLQYNTGSPRFTTYTSKVGQYAQIVSLENVIIGDTVYSRDLADKMGTHCYPFTIKAGEYTGAHFYVPTYREGDVKIFWDEVAVDEDIVAGYPYLVVPAEEGAKLEAVGNKVEGAEARTEKGFVGSYEPKLIEEAGNYIVYNNQFRLVAPNANVYVGANRAYIHLEGVSTTEVAPAPGRRRIVLNNASVENATALENITEEFGTEQVAKKVVINGTIYIVRGAEVYTVEGQLVK